MQRCCQRARGARLVRRYRPFLIYQPAKGWAFYPNHYTNPYTSRNCPRFKSRQIGWFLDPAVAIMMERRERSI